MAAKQANGFLLNCSIFAALGGLFGCIHRLPEPGILTTLSGPASHAPSDLRRTTPVLSLDEAPTTDESNHKVRTSSIFLVGNPTNQPLRKSIRVQLEKELQNSQSEPNQSPITILSIGDSTKVPRRCPKKTPANSVTTWLADQARPDIQHFHLPGPTQWVCSKDPSGDPELGRNTLVELPLSDETSGNSSLQLVLLDLVPFFFPEVGDRSPAHQQTAAQSLAAQQRLIQELRSANDPRPKILVALFPVESAGVHGLGTRRMVASFERFPPWLQTAIEDGVFTGVLSAYEKNHQMSLDLAPAIKRSAHRWIQKPVFQITTGASAGSDFSSQFDGRFSALWRGVALQPDLYEGGIGFVRLDLAPQVLEATLFQRSALRLEFEQTSMSFPLQADIFSTETTSPSLAPCLRCDPVQGAPGW